MSSIQHKAGAWSVQRYAVSVRLTDDSTCEWSSLCVRPMIDW